MELRPIRYEQCDSTNERAFQALADGSARHGDVHLAQAQSAGRGRFGRRWHSAPGEGLYLSLILLPKPPLDSGLPLTLTMIGGLAVLEVARGLGLLEARLKWPNDVLVRGAKLSGVLVESRGLDPEQPAFVVGIGLNVAQRSFPPELTAERAVTSLALAGAQVPVAQAEGRLLGALARWVERALGAAPQGQRGIVAEFARELDLIGQAVAIDHGSGQRLGRLIAFEGQHLVFESVGGVFERVPLAHVQALKARVEAGS